MLTSRHARALSADRVLPRLVRIVSASGAQDWVLNVIILHPRPRAIYPRGPLIIVGTLSRVGALGPVPP
jgi:hypothetical protein